MTGHLFLTTDLHLSRPVKVAALHVTLEAFALPLGVPGSTTDLPSTGSSRHVLLFGLFPIACSTSLLLSETTRSTKTIPVLATYKGVTETGKTERLEVPQCTRAYPTMLHWYAAYVSSSIYEQ